MQEINTLTPRQLEVLAEYASGYTSKEISGRIYLSYHTIRGYLKLAKKKTGARGLPQIVAWAIAADLLCVNPDGSVSVRENNER
jgi:DNA-binding CsgD family transcriptional regulator